eukprot:7763663-Alexandrium_andersonii.AAC.1
MDCASGVVNQYFRDIVPLDPRLRCQIHNLQNKLRNLHPPGASGTKCEAVPEATQFQYRALEAIPH